MEQTDHVGYEPLHGGPRGTFMKFDWRMLKKLQVCGRFYSFMKEGRENGNPEKLMKESLKSERIQ